MTSGDTTSRRLMEKLIHPNEAVDALNEATEKEIPKIDDPNKISIKIQSLLHRLQVATGSFFQGTEGLELSDTEAAEVYVTSIAHFFNIAVMQTIKAEDQETFFATTMRRFFGEQNRTEH